MYSKFGTVSDHLNIVEAKFASMETLLDAKVMSIDGQLDALRHQLPANGRMLQENFVKMAAEIDAIKLKQGESLTRAMIDELDLMRRHVIEHDGRIRALAS